MTMYEHWPWQCLSDTGGGIGGCSTARPEMASVCRLYTGAPLLNPACHTMTRKPKVEPSDQAASVVCLPSTHARTDLVPEWLSKKDSFWACGSSCLSHPFRRAPESGASVLVVRDTQQHVFGCFTSESWRVAPRYYGTGESFIFQIQVCTAQS